MTHDSLRTEPIVVVLNLTASQLKILDLFKDKSLLGLKNGGEVEMFKATDVLDATQREITIS